MTGTDSREPAVHRALGEASRVAIMGLLRDHRAGLDTARIAAATGLHPNTVRHHLDVLAAAGLVRTRPDPTRTGGRPRRLFLTTDLAAGHNGDSDGYPLLAQIVVAELAGRSDGAKRAIAAGRRWARQPARTTADPAGGTVASSTDAADALTTLFDELGFRPECVAGPDGWQILLHHCPFLALARQHQEIVCGVHLGLLQGTLTRLGRPAAHGHLAPFITPTLCAATVSRSSD